MYSFATTHTRRLCLSLSSFMRAHRKKCEKSTHHFCQCSIHAFDLSCKFYCTDAKICASTLLPLSYMIVVASVKFYFRRWHFRLCTIHMYYVVCVCAYVCRAVYTLSPISIFVAYFSLILAPSYLFYRMKKKNKRGNENIQYYVVAILSNVLYHTHNVWTKHTHTHTHWCKVL